MRRTIKVVIATIMGFNLAAWPFTIAPLLSSTTAWWTLASNTGSTPRSLPDRHRTVIFLHHENNLPKLRSRAVRVAIPPHRSLSNCPAHTIPVQCSHARFVHGDEDRKVSPTTPRRCGHDRSASGDGA